MLLRTNLEQEVGEKLKWEFSSRYRDGYEEILKKEVAIRVRLQIKNLQKKFLRHGVELFDTYDGEGWEDESSFFVNLDADACERLFHIVCFDCWTIQKRRLSALEATVLLRARMDQLYERFKEQCYPENWVEEAEEAVELAPIEDVIRSIKMYGGKTHEEDENEDEDDTDEEDEDEDEDEDA